MDPLVNLEQSRGIIRTQRLDGLGIEEAREHSPAELEVKFAVTSDA